MQKLFSAILIVGLVIVGGSVEDKAEAAETFSQGTTNINKSNYPPFVTIPTDWLYRKRPDDTTYSSPKKVYLQGTLSNVSRRGGIPRYEDRYFTPDGGSENDEIIIACSRFYGSACVDEPSEAIYDESGRQVIIGIRRELERLVNDTHARTGANPKVVIEGSVITRQDQRIGKITTASASDLNIYLVDGVVSEKNVVSQQYRILRQKAKLQAQAEKVKQEAAPKEYTPEQIASEKRDLNSETATIFTPILKQRNWAEANQFCSELTYAGMTGWRLPQIDELESLAKLKEPNARVLLKNRSGQSGEGSLWTATSRSSGAHMTISNQTFVRFAGSQNHIDRNRNDVVCARY